MKKSFITQSFAVILSAAVCGSSFATGPAAPAMPEFTQALTPPAQLGYVESFNQGKTDHPVILIEDLHANFGVQKKIEGMLKFLQPKISQGRSMVLGVEGAWGKFDLASIQRRDAKFLAPMSDFLLKEAEISGMTHFALLSPQPVNLVGIDNPSDYIVHSELTRKSMTARLRLALKLDALKQALNQARADAPSSLRHLWKIESDFHAGKLGLDELGRKLKRNVANYGQAESALVEAKQTAANNIQDKNLAFEMRNVVEAYADVDLLGRLFRQQLTFEEVQMVSKRIPAMLAVIEALLPRENLTLWKDAIGAAIDYYAVALVRNKPMAEHALELSMNNANTSVVIVTGGFHTAGIVEELKTHGVSYVVLAPLVDSHTSRDERLYLKRMMDIHVTESEIAKAAAQASPRQSSLIGADVAGAASGALPGAESTVPNAFKELPLAEGIFSGERPAVGNGNTIPQDKVGINTLIDQAEGPNRDRPDQLPSRFSPRRLFAGLPFIGPYFRNRVVELEPIAIDSKSQTVAQVGNENAVAAPTEGSFNGSKLAQYGQGAVATTAIIGAVTNAGISAFAHAASAHQAFQPQLAGVSTPMALAVTAIAAVAAVGGSLFRKDPTDPSKTRMTAAKERILYGIQA